jgi:hypothetical protein
VSDSDALLIGLAGGAIGAVLTAVFALLARAWIARGEVSLHDEEAEGRNAQLVAWVDDRTRELLQTMAGSTNSLAGQGQLKSGAHGRQLAEAKADALHEFREEHWRARIDLAAVRAKEGGWALWRFWRRSRAPRLTEDTLQTVENFLERWREPVTRHGGEVSVYDRTRRTTEDALAELPSLRLT